LPEIHRHPDVAAVPERLRNYWHSYRLTQGLSPATRERRRNEFRKYQDLTGILHRAGVPLLAGTDAPEVGPVPGFGLHHELQEFVRDGLTPYQALETATIHPARYLRQSTEFGTIEAGKRADLVLLAADPLKDISNTQKIDGVMLRGRWLDAKQLNGKLQQVQQEYRKEQDKVATMLKSDPVGAMRYLSDHDPLGRLTALSISNLASTESVPDLVSMLQAMRKADPKAETVSEDSINELGYVLMNKKLYPQSIAVLRMNTEDFPKSPNTWDSLADALARSGDVSGAVSSYQKALEVDPGYPNASPARKFIGEHAQK